MPEPIQDIAIDSDFGLGRFQHSNLGKILPY